MIRGDELFEFPRSTTGPSGVQVREYPTQIKIKKMYRVVPVGAQLTQLDCGCWYQQRGLSLVRFRACDAHSLETWKWNEEGYDAK